MQQHLRTPKRNRRARGLTRLLVALPFLAVAAVWLRPWSAPQFSMPDTLAEIADTEGVWDSHWTQNRAKAAELVRRLAQETDPAARLALRHDIAMRRLVAGQTEIAIAELQALVAELPVSAPEAQREQLRADLALAWFRLGEVQNCLDNRSASACILPIDPAAIHQRRLGASEAVQVWTQLLADPATDPVSALGDRWLLNIAHMTLGSHPHGVPERWRISMETFADAGAIGRFTDVAPLRGIDKFGLSGGVILDDFNSDGWLDALISSQGLSDPLDYFENDGQGGFTRRTEDAGLTRLTGGLNIVQADVDNDGFTDVFVTRGAWLHDRGRHPNSLLRNRGGRFEDVTAEAGVLSFYPSQTAVFADIDNDGWLDLFVGNEILRRKSPQQDPLASNQAAVKPWPADAKSFELYRNRGDGRFEEIGAGSGIAIDGSIKGAAFGDIDNDGWIDLYISMRGAPNRLYRNRGPAAGARFEDVTRAAGVAEPRMSFPVWFWDQDNDGWEDLLVFANYTDLPNMVRDHLGEPALGERPRVYRNQGHGRYVDQTRAAGLDRVLLAMGANYGDLDNDGWLDFYVGTGSPPLNMLVPNRMFRSRDGQAFEEVTAAGGFGVLQKGHGIAFGDVDRDGDADVLQNLGGAYESDRFWSVLFDNPGPPGNWIGLRLEGVEANRSAIGARVQIITETADGRRRTLHRTVSSGGSFGANPLELHVGLGDAVRVVDVVVRWPRAGGPVQHFGPLEAGRRYRLREGQAAQAGLRD